jgi:outer membrane protein
LSFGSRRVPFGRRKNQEQIVKRHSTLLLAGAASAALLAGAPSSARALSLSEALAAAYESNPQIVEARAQLQAVDEGVNQARAGFRPNAQADASYGLAWDSSPQGFNSRETSDPFNAGVTVSQPLYDGGRTVNSVRAREADVLAARSRLVETEQQIFFDVVSAFLDILRDGERERLARNNVRVIAEQLRATDDRFEVGEVTRTDVSQARARLAESNANLAVATGNLERSRQAFRALVGIEPVDLRQPPPPPALPQSLEDARAIALDSHPLIEAARFDERSASSEVRAAIADLLPEVSAVASVDFDDNVVFKDGDGNDSLAATVGVRATVPLYRGGSEYSRIRQSQAQASAARAGILSEGRERERVVEAAWTELLVARANIRSTTEQVAAAQLAFEGVREEAIVGSRTTLDVLDAEQELLDARVRLVDSQRNEAVASYGLLSAIGALTAAELNLDVAQYDPTVNYDRNNARWIGYERTEDTVWEELWRP